MIEQKGMTFDFCYSFSFSSSLFFLGGKRKGEKNIQSRGQKSCLSVRSFLTYKTGLSYLAYIGIAAALDSNSMRKTKQIAKAVSQKSHSEKK